MVHEGSVGQQGEHDKAFRLSPDTGVFRKKEISAPAILPDILDKALRRLSPGDGFFEAGYQAAIEAGCEMLFEVPAGLIRREADRAAAISCERGTVNELFFLVFDTAGGSVAILEENEVPEVVVDLTRSYAGVLGLIARDGRLVRPLIH